MTAKHKIFINTIRKFNMKKSFLTLLLVLFILSAVAGQAQWRITTTQGNVYRGVIINQDNDNITLKTLDNTELTLKREIVESTVRINTRIETKSGEEYIGFVTGITDDKLTIVLDDAGETVIKRAEIEGIETLDSITVLIKKDNETFYAVGFTLFGPGEANLSVACVFEDVGVRVCAGNRDYNYGWQVNMLLNINRTDNYSHNISIGLGNSITDSMLLYGGIFYDINIYGLFLEFGLAATIYEGDGDLDKFPSVQIEKSYNLFPTVQLGYVFEF